MSTPFRFSINRLAFNEHYRPAENTRLTTNFANLARGEHRQQNLRNALAMITNRFNAMARWDNPAADRYALELEIVSVDMNLEAGDEGEGFPAIEILNTQVLDRKTNTRTPGIAGNNFSSYVRDYDFSRVLVKHNHGQATFSTPPGFGELHGKLFNCFVNCAAYTAHFSKAPVICLSVSSNVTYQRTANRHPVLGVEYLAGAPSLTEQYFEKMGLRVRYFMPPHSMAPLAFYASGDLLNDYTALELISTISTMETFQRIYRPEIYNANAAAGQYYRPSLNHADYAVPRVVYDREERSRLAMEQGMFAEVHLIKPYQALLAQWAAHYVFQ